MYFFHHSTDSFTNLHIPQPLMENAEKVIVMAKTIQRSAENYYKFNVARKIQPSKCIIYLNHDDNLYQDHKCYLMVGTSKNMRMQHEDARGSRLGQL